MDTQDGTINYQQRKMERAQRKAAKKAEYRQRRDATKYRAVLNFDFTLTKGTEYQRLVAASLQLGWKYVETSALTFRGDLPNILVAMEVIGKQCEKAGILSALTLHIQGSTCLGGMEYPQAARYPDALKQIRGETLPEPNS